METESVLTGIRTQMEKNASTFITTHNDREELLDECGLGGVDCPLCGNTGQIISRGPGLLELHVYECKCMKTRRSLRSIRNAGMLDMTRRYTLDSFQTDNEKRKTIKRTAEKFVQSETGWFFISGQSGSGKTHICTAICSGLLQKKNCEIYFMPWRDESTVLKARINDAEWYEAKIKKLKRVPALYIDDLFKGGVSEADVRLAFEILNARYNDTSLRTIISSEMNLTRILEIDEATGGRIYERSRGFVVEAPEENWRLR